MQCPFLKQHDVDNGQGGSVRVYVDHLSSQPVAYSIDSMPGGGWVRRYVDGGGIRQYLFCLRSVNHYDPKDIPNNSENLVFFQEFADWLTQNKPPLPAWIKVEALSDGYFHGTSEGQDRAIYQIQCRIMYTV